MMKKLYFLILGGGKVKISYLLLAFLFATTTAATAEVLLNENFEYEGTLLYNSGTNGWWKYASNAAAEISFATTPALSYPEYQPVGIGRSVQLTNTASGQDLYKLFPKAVGSGDLYISALINITNVEDVTTANATHFLCIIPQTKSGLKDGGSGSEYAKLYAYKSSEGKYKLAVTRSSSTLSTTTDEYNYGTTYLIVVKYTFVDGVTNDIVTLYVNPAKTAEPTTANAIYSSGNDGDASTSYGGITAIELRQGQTSTKNAATLTIDAIRVATTWAELFPSATTDPDPKKPVISAPESIKFGSSYYVLAGESYDVKITVKGTNLKDDVTFVSTCDQVTLSATSATKEQVMSEEGFELTLTLKATGETCEPKLQIASTNATTVEVPITWTVLTTIDVADLAELRANAATVNLEEGPVFRITNPVVVSYQDGDKYIYLQDDKGGIRMKDERGVVSATALPTGTKIAAGLLGTVSNNFGYEFIPSRDITIDGTATVNAVTATLAEIDADKAAYVDRLVRIEHVTFNNFGEKEVLGAAKDTIMQEGYKAALRLFSSVTDIAGQTIPARATVVGISTSTSALLIAPRGWSDITVESSTVAIDKATIATNCYTQAGMLIVENATTDIAIYNLTGICVAKAAAMPYASFTLPQGVYAVKMNGQTCKVVVK